MTQQDRQKHSRQKILAAAMAEFGTQDCDQVTMDQICARHGISKGMMYHYYAGKDELFLLCVREVFDALLAALEPQLDALSACSPDRALHEFFVLREHFFQQHPAHKHIFENALLRTPAGLTDQIDALRAPVRALNQRFLTQTLSRLPLRSALGSREVTRYFESIDLFFWQLVRQYRAEDAQAVADLHDLSVLARQVLDLLLYGIVAPEAHPDLCTQKKAR